MKLKLKLQQVNSVTKSSRLSERKFFVFLSLIFVAVGCDPSAENNSIENAEKKISAIKVQIDPSSLQRTPLSLVHEKGELHVGDPAESGLALFPKPKNATDVTKFPDALGQAFTARGWETADSAFGMLLMNGRIAFSMFTTYGASYQRAEEWAAFYSKKLAQNPEVISEDNSVGYWFWNLDNQRLMLCLGVDFKGRQSLTIAVGESKVMDALRMNPITARTDLKDALGLLKQKMVSSER